MTIALIRPAADRGDRVEPVRPTRFVVAGDAAGRPTDAACGHLDHIVNGVSPSTLEGCEDCPRDGGSWVHLRECLVCGHVACCDNSPSRHATAHWRATGHPIIQSFQPGEDWAWCYPDELLLVPDESARRTDADA